MLVLLVEPEGGRNFLKTARLFAYRDVIGTREEFVKGLRAITLGILSSLLLLGRQCQTIEERPLRSLAERQIPEEFFVS